MKVIVVNASPMLDRGNTAVILNPFLEGMRAAGAEVEVCYTQKLNLKPCQGEFNCQFKTPGKCFHKDDMETWLPKLEEADLQVYATPVYVAGMPAPLKNLWDRMLPLVHLSFELREGHCCHPLRKGVAAGKVALVSTCGCWELDNFDPLLVHLQAMCRTAQRTFVGAVLRPQGSALKRLMAEGAPVNDILEAAREAGRQLIQEGAMASRTLATISRPLMPLEAYIEATNQTYSQALAALEGK